MSKGNFNSIKVQLKPAAMPTTPDTTPFQFHKGTIKTRKPTAKNPQLLISIP